MCSHIQKIKSYIDNIENLCVELPKELIVNMVLNSLCSSYSQFIMNYNMNNVEKILMELHGILKKYESRIKKPTSSNPTTPMLAIEHGNTKRKRVSHPKVKGKGTIGQSEQSSNRIVQAEIVPTINRNEAVFFN